MATIVKTPSGTWKAVIRKTGWPTSSKTFRTKRDADDWVRVRSALRIGLVSQVAESEKLLESAMAMANEFAAHPIHSLRLSKRLIRDSQEVSLPISLGMASSMQALAQHTQDRHEALAAFMEKRAPVFQNT